MRRLWFALALAVPCALFGARVASAGDNDLLDDDAKDAGTKADAEPSSGLGEYKPPVATIKGHAYTLTECLALADRNFPNLWVARAHLAFVHAQLDEAKWTPFWQWSFSSNFYPLGQLGGTTVFSAAPQSSRNLSLGGPYNAEFQADLSGTVPLYTFGKITAAREAAEANVRVNEWDLEKYRQQARMDVRRAFFGAMLARDARYILKDVLERLDKAIDGLKQKLKKGDRSVEDVDLFRLQVLHDGIMARAGEPDKGERYAMAALRFYTGVQTAFDIPDEPLKRPTTVIAPLVRYLAAARIFRPEVNMARAGIEARRSLVDLAKAQLFPDIGIGFGASYAVSGSGVTPQYGNFWANDPFNHFYAGAGLGIRWSLDLMPKAARVAQAESQLEEVRAQERMALGGLAVEVENAYGVVLEAKNREESWDRAEHRTLQWISTVSDAIDLGTKDEKALNEPLRAYMDARVNHIYSLMDFNIALSDLARASGWDSAAPSGT
jgi:outer membrane protein TolC